MNEPGATSDRAYAEAAAHLIPRFEALSSQDVLAPVADLLPDSPARILDIGAGTGRDAAWLAGQGHAVIAVEPVEALRSAGQSLHRSSAITWFDDRLPDLGSVADAPFAAILVVAIWQHLDADARESAFVRLHALLAPGARLFLSLRHGPDVPGRPVFPCDPDETIALAQRAGLYLVRRRAAASVQAHNRQAGVHWTWFVLGRG